MNGRGMTMAMGGAKCIVTPAKAQARLCAIFCALSAVFISATYICISASLRLFIMLSAFHLSWSVACALVVILLGTFITHEPQTLLGSHQHAGRQETKEAFSVYQLISLVTRPT